MKATGVVRRVDELGRIVVPKEIRKNLRIRTGTPLEIFIDSTGSVVFKKHSAIAELADFAYAVTDAIVAASELVALVVDMDKVVAVSGDKRKEFIDSPVSNQLEEAISNRKPIVLNKASASKLIDIKQDGAATYNSMIIGPVVANGDCFGAVVLVSFADNANFGDCEVKIAQTMAQFLAKHLES